MEKVVIDTNVIISAAISKIGKPATIIDLALNKYLTLFYNKEILIEYKEVLLRKKFSFSPETQEYFLNGIKLVGNLITTPVSTIPLPDESDRKFYDVAKTSGAILITGNLAHYPTEETIMNPTDFLKRLNKLNF